MPTWTVISTVTRTGGIHDTYDGDPIAAIPGHADVYGDSVHTATVQAGTADEALNTTRAAFRVAGSITANTPTGSPTLNGRWTVVGVADSGGCASHRTVAVIAGEHTVQGRYESPLSHRWARVVDATDARTADHAGYRAADESYADTWD